METINDIDNKTFKKPTRMSNFELLRIICMILIVAHHFSVHSIIYSSPSTLNRYIIRGFAIGGKLAVNVYVLISGYFMIHSSFKLKKLFKLIVLTMFYSVSIYSLCCLLNFTSFNFKVFVSQLTPLYSAQYWFMSYFVLLYILSPFLNKLLKHCSHMEFIVLIFVLLLLQIEPSKIFLSNLAWFITLYIIASYIRIYPNRITNNNKTIVPIFCISFLTILLLYMFFNINLWGMTNLMCLICSVSLFCLFKNISIKHNKFINLISSTSLAIYLIHDNNLLRPLIWNKWLNVPKHILLNHFFLFGVISIITIFMACCILDLIRQNIIKLLSTKLKRKNNHTTSI